MRKNLILGAFLLVAAIGIAKEVNFISIGDGGATDCPSECDSGNELCCKTKGGSTYFGKCKC